MAQRWFYIFALAAFIFSPRIVAAQDNWLRPDKYFYEVGDTATVIFARGDDFIAKPYLPALNDILMLEYRTKDRVIDIRNMVRDSVQAPVRVRVQREGYQSIWFRSERALDFNGEEFNQFLKFYGFDEFYADRKAHNLLSVPAHIRAQNIVQLAFRAGKNDGDDWNKLQNLPIEVIPDKNPETLKRGDRIEFTIYENGSPAFGVQVKIFNRWNKRTTVQNIYTEKSGKVSTTISNPGDWMVTAARVDKNESENQYTAYTFTLNFGYR